MRMQKAKALILTSLFLAVSMVLLPQSGAAEGTGETYTWEKKLGRGFLNIISFPVEIAAQIHLVSEEDSLLAGWTYGVVKGIGTGVVRLGAGVIDLVTFPFGWPNADKSPLIEPEFAWDKPGVKYS